MSPEIWRVYRPRWSGEHIRFEIMAEDAAVSCSISRMAIEVLSDGRLHTPEQAMSHFMNMQGRIAAAAHRKASRQSMRNSQMQIWSTDLDDEPASPVEGPAPS